jgi:3-dehydroquinate synthase
MERVVQLCAIRHLEHIRDGGDPFEFGSARPLDFGHWSAHKLESMTDHRLRHGEAVAIGIALDLHCAAILGFISDADCHRMCEAMERCGLNLKHPSLTRRHNSTGCLVILDGLEEFRQHLGGQLTLAMPKGLGGKQDIYELAETVVEEGLRRLITRSPAAIKTASFPPLPASSSPKEQKSQP